MFRLLQHKSVVSLAFKLEQFGFIGDSYIGDLYWRLPALMIQFFFFILMVDRDSSSGRIPMLILTVQHISKVLVKTSSQSGPEVA